MAEDRLSLRMKKQDPQYIDDCPMILQACALYFDRFSTKGIAQLKWKNIDSRSIRAVVIELQCVDIFEQHLCSVQYQYDRLCIARGISFGDNSPIYIESANAYSFEIIVKAVSFTDNTIWHTDSNVPLTSLPPSNKLAFNADMLAQLKRELKRSGVPLSALTYEPQTCMGLWQCGCGSWQKQSDPCFNCQIQYSRLIALEDETVLTKHLILYQDYQEKLQLETAKLAEEAHIAREKQEKEQKEKEEAERRLREEQARIEAEEAARKRVKTKKILLLSTLTAAILIVAGYFTVTYVQRVNKYNDAVACIKIGSLAKARSLLGELEDFKDSYILLKQLDADELFSYNLYGAAHEIYTTLPSEYQTHAREYESFYSSADKAEQSGNYVKASRLFAVLGKYRDSESRYLAAEKKGKEALAQSYISSGDFRSAHDVYDSLGYKEEAAECLYQLADSQDDSQPWLAYEYFLSLGDYKDSAARAKIIYNSILNAFDDSDSIEQIKVGSIDGKYIIFQKEGLYGFVDLSTFSIVVDAIWNDATIMTDGYAYVKNNFENWGVIDHLGNIVVSPCWKNIRHFPDCGYALRSKDGNSTSKMNYLMDNQGTLLYIFNEDNIEYQGNGFFSDPQGHEFYSTHINDYRKFSANGENVSHLLLLDSDKLSGYYKAGSVYCYGVIDLLQFNFINHQRWEDPIYHLPCRNQVNGKYGWINADGTDLISPSYDFMHSYLINGYIIAGKYTSQGNLVYYVLDSSTGEIMASHFSSLADAYHYYGKPDRDMSTHGQLMLALSNAGFDDSTANIFIFDCLNGFVSNAEENFLSIDSSHQFKDSWDRIKSGIAALEYDTEVQLLDTFITLGLN